MIVIHHNPECGTSRNVLRLIEASGEAHSVIAYLETGWTRAQLLGLFAAAGLSVRAALRETKSPAAELGLLEDGVGDEALLEAMLAYPVLVNRPIVCSAKGVKLCRPSRTVLGLLDQRPASKVVGEDGEVLFDPASLSRA
ncbi:arsenate reductase family protein [Henriciella pelagia]|jgi:arsenate reductase (glutaredoxin)|uniref:Arsenate reductase n=1 Tax=Henriciella pelagia TaxID=1977912 RepID=A0ABQ1JUZ0_9PROT|nr:arsenate reductase family protein [Henriciella pelagia]GGB77870.1 arsenate reductase [Henriciella pelagia]